MNVVHLSNTPLAGSPIRICQALNASGKASARLIQHEFEGYTSFNFDRDLVWDQNRDEAMALIESADVLHLHNYINLDCDRYTGLNFRKLWESGKPMLRQFHSSPELVAKLSGETEAEIAACPIPKLVIAQSYERQYPAAMLIPNIVIDSGEPAPRQGALRIGYAPSNFSPSRDVRWGGKGYPETVKILKRLQRWAKSNKLPLEVDLIEQVSHEECLRRKASCDIAIDEMVTGGYHLNTLESLMMGSATLVFMDERVVRAIQNICGRDDFPALNVPMEDAESVLMELIKNPELCRSIGKKSRAWMLKNWNEEDMAARFIPAYQHAIAAPKQPFPARFSTDPADMFRNQTIYNLRWQERHNRWPAPLPKPVLKGKALLGNTLRKVGLR